MEAAAQSDFSEMLRKREQRGDATRAVVSVFIPLLWCFSSFDVSDDAFG